MVCLDLLVGVLSSLSDEARSELYASVTTGSAEQDETDAEGQDDTDEASDASEDE